MFSHELIHLAKKDTTKVSEEEYAYNLACFVVFLARIDVMPRDILRLFEEPPSEEAILNAIEKVMGLKFNSIEEYFDFTGVIPYFAEYDLRARRVKRRNGYNSTFVSMITLVELMDGATYDPSALKILLRLMEMDDD